MKLNSESTLSIQVNTNVEFCLLYGWIAWGRDVVVLSGKFVSWRLGVVASSIGCWGYQNEMRCIVFR